MRFPRIALTLLCAAALAVASAAAASGETIEIAVPENVPITGNALAVLQRAYEKLGITLKIRMAPMRRSMLSASQGDVDGELMRTEQAIALMPQLLPVKAPLIRVNYFAYRAGACPGRLAVSGLEPYRLAYFRGTRAIEMTFPAHNLRPATTHWDGIRNLQSGLADYLIGEELEVDALLLKYRLREICKSTDPILTLDLIHALNKRHAELVPRLERTLKDMSEQGETAHIQAAATQRLRDAILNSPSLASSP